MVLCFISIEVLFCYSVGFLLVELFIFLLFNPNVLALIFSTFCFVHKWLLKIILSTCGPQLDFSTLLHSRLWIAPLFTFRSFLGRELIYSVSTIIKGLVRWSTYAYRLWVSFFRSIVSNIFLSAFQLFFDSALPQLYLLLYHIRFEFHQIYLMSRPLLLGIWEIRLQLASEGDLGGFISTISVDTLHIGLLRNILIVLFSQTCILQRSLLSSGGQSDSYFFRIVGFVFFETESATTTVLSRSLYDVPGMFYHFFNALHGAIEIVEVVTHALNKVITRTMFGGSIFRVSFVYLHLPIILLLNFIADLFLLAIITKLNWLIN